MAVAERKRARAAANSASRSPPSSRVASTPTSALVMPPFVTRSSKPAERPNSLFAENCGVYAARAAPDAAEVVVHYDIVPAVVVRIVDQRRPAPRREGTGREISPPAR